MNQIAVAPTALLETNPPKARQWHAIACSANPALSLVIIEPDDEGELVVKRPERKRTSREEQAAPAGEAPAADEAPKAEKKPKRERAAAKA